MASAELVEAARRGQRMLNHVGRDRHDRRRPGRVREQRQDREDAVIDRHLLADRGVELVLDQALREVPGERGMSREIGEVARAPSLRRPADICRRRRARRSDRRRRRSGSCDRCRSSPSGPAGAAPARPWPAPSRRTAAPTSGPSAACDHRNAQSRARASRRARRRSVPCQPFLSTAAPRWPGRAAMKLSSVSPRICAPICSRF